MVQDAVACIAAGKCTVITMTHFYASWVLLVLVGLLIVIIFMISFFTPAFAFLGAKMRKEDLFMSFDAVNRVSFEKAKRLKSGLAHAKGYGDVELVAGSALRERRSGILLFLRPMEVAYSIPPEFLRILAALKAAKFRINHFGDYKEIIDAHDMDELKRVKKRIEDDPRIKASDRTQMIGVMDKRIEELAQKTEEEKSIFLVPNSKTIPIPTLRNYFPFTVNPQLFEAQKEAEIVKARQMIGGVTSQMVLWIIMLLVGAAIAFVIIMKLVKNPDCPTMQCICESGPGILRNLTG